MQPQGEKLGHTGPSPHFLIWIIFYPRTLFRLKRQSPSDEGGDPEHLGSELGSHLTQKDALGSRSLGWISPPSQVLGLGEHKPRNKGNLCNNLVVPRPRELRVSPHQEKEQEVEGRVAVTYVV